MNEKHKSLIIIAIILILSVIVIVVCMPLINRDAEDLGEDEGSVEEVEVNLDVNFNNGATVFDDEIVMQPGDSIIESVFVKNDGDVDLYYRIYLENIVGTLGEVATITIYDQDMAVLCSENVLDFTLNNSYISNNMLEVGASETLYIGIYISEDADNEYQRAQMEIDIIVNAIVAE
ncbi:MAG: hypothetical protein R3Y23_06210 [Bacillota bacterium]